MLAVLSIGLVARAEAMPAVSSPYFGRWTVADDKPVFSPKGREYKTIDIAPCGKDFCGVSVGDKGQCGAVLFRFLGIHADGDREISGHGKWGKGRSKLEIDEMGSDGMLALALGDAKFEMNSRSSSMPKFQANYKRIAESTCHAR